jgi:hypothetical protein
MAPTSQETKDWWDEYDSWWSSSWADHAGSWDDHVDSSWDHHVDSSWDDHVDSWWDGDRNVGANEEEDDRPVCGACGWVVSVCVCASSSTSRRPATWSSSSWRQQQTQGQGDVAPVATQQQQAKEDIEEAPWRVGGFGLPAESPFPQHRGGFAQEFQSPPIPRVESPLGEDTQPRVETPPEPAVYVYHAHGQGWWDSTTGQRLSRVQVTGQTPGAGARNRRSIQRQVAALMQEELSTVRQQMAELQQRVQPPTGEEEPKVEPKVEQEEQQRVQPPTGEVKEEQAETKARPIANPIAVGPPPPPKLPAKVGPPPSTMKIVPPRPKWRSDWADMQPSPPPTPPPAHMAPPASPRSQASSDNPWEDVPEMQQAMAAASGRVRKDGKNMPAVMAEIAQRRPKPPPCVPQAARDALVMRPPKPPPAARPFLSAEDPPPWREETPSKRKSESSGASNRSSRFNKMAMTMQEPDPPLPVVKTEEDEDMDTRPQPKGTVLEALVAAEEEEEQQQQQNLTDDLTAMPMDIEVLTPEDEEKEEEEKEMEDDCEVGSGGTFPDYNPFEWNPLSSQEGQAETAEDEQPENQDDQQQAVKEEQQPEPETQFEATLQWWEGGARASEFPEVPNDEADTEDEDGLKMDSYIDHEDPPNYGVCNVAELDDELAKADDDEDMK